MCRYESTHFEQIISDSFNPCSANGLELFVFKKKFPLALLGQPKPIGIRFPGHFPLLSDVIELHLVAMNAF